jgi:hypothetical protein
MLNLSDGDHSLLDIADRSGMPFSAISAAAELLRESGLLSAGLAGTESAEAKSANAGADLPEVGQLPQKQRVAAID